MENLERILAEHPLFAGLDKKYLELIAGCSKNVRFNMGEMINRDGETSNEFYLIRHGAVSLEIHSPEKGAITFLTLNDGDVLGWSWLMQPYRGRFDARATQVTRALYIDATCLRSKFESDHELEREFLKRFLPVIVERLDAMSMQLLDLYSTES
jgi:CRP/FNR family transcriptional regulator, cyclic AMP receptor protein